ncbi:MAG: hypothetical protein WA728_20865 [Xanthobacteraceae bacterium]
MISSAKSGFPETETDSGGDLAAALRVTNISDAGSYSGSLGRGPLDPDVSQQTAHIEDQAVAAAAYH